MSEKTRFMVAGKIFGTLEEAVKYGKKLKNVDAFELAKVEIEKTKSFDILTHTPFREVMKKLKEVI
jgi:hypothetical protein